MTASLASTQQLHTSTVTMEGHQEEAGLTEQLEKLGRDTMQVASDSKEEGEEIKKKTNLNLHPPIFTSVTDRSNILHGIIGCNL